MTASRMKAFVTYLLALLLAMLIALIEGGGVARADAPSAHADTRGDVASAAQSEWEQRSQSRDQTDAADHDAA